MLYHERSEDERETGEEIPKIYLWKTSRNKLKLSCKLFFFLRRSRNEKNSDRLRNLKWGSPRIMFK